MATGADGESKITYGGKVVGRALKQGGVEAVFGIYGSINLAIEEANRLGVKMYHFRHEQSAGFAADAYARCLRRPGVCFSSSAPGFVNLVSPIAQAKGTLSPVVLLNGQHGISGDGLDTVQEGYATEVMKPFAKWTHRCLDWNLHSYWVTKALAESVQYPPGPVVLEFPRNSLNVRGPERQMKYLSEGRPQPTWPHGDPREVERAVKLLLAAERPLLIVGDGVYWSDGMRALREFVEYLNIPVHSRRTARGAVPENHPLAFTGGYRAGLLRDADVICIVGLRATWLEEWFEPPEWTRSAKYIQVQETAAEIWPALATEVAVVGCSGPVLTQMLAAAKDLTKSPPGRDSWLAQLTDARTKFKSRQAENLERHLKSGKRVMHPEILGSRLAEFLDSSATIIFDSFTGTSFFTDKLEAKFAGQILDAGLHQPVGHGIGMCVGAQVARPCKPVVTLIGDGGFGISAMDMETLLRHKLPAVVVLLNNSSWAGVAAGHDLFYPDMGSWDNLSGIRYDRMFRELGCHTEHVEKPEEIVPALDRSFSSGKPAVVNVVGDTNDVHPFRLRICWGDAWTRGDIDSLPEGAKAQLRKAASPATIHRTRKFWLDNGVDIPAEELAAMADFPKEKL